MKHLNLWNGWILPLIVASASAGAQVLRVDGDLILQPSVEWNEIVGEIQISPMRAMADMRFAGPPYGAEWTDVQAVALEGLRITTVPEPGGVVMVEMSWDRPAILITNMNLDFGRCFGVHWHLPEGGWSASGHMIYDYQLKSLVWIDFAFLNNALGAAMVNLGDCSFGADHLQTVTDHLLLQAKDPAWLQTLVQQSLLKWATVTFKTAESRLLDPIHVQMGPYTEMTWQPSAVIRMNNGLWRVPGQLVFDTSDSLPKYDFGTVRRTEAESVLNDLMTSQMVLPLNAMEQIAAALSRNRGFFSRTVSSLMPSLNQLLGNRKTQKYEWGDLRSFPLNSLFAFDVTAYGPVTLGDRRSADGGLSYSAKIALAIHAQADVWDMWFPYFDFRSVETGRSALTIVDGDFQIRLTYDQLHTRSYLRDEFAQVRVGVDDFTNMTLLNKRFDQFFATRVFSVELPRWRLGNGWEIVGQGLQETTRSLRVPLQVRPER